MFTKLVKIIVVSLIMYYILGLLLYPLRGILQSVSDTNQILYALINLMVLVIAAALSFFIASKFFTLAQGEAKKLAVVLGALNFIVGVFALISNGLLVARLNSLSGYDAHMMNIYSEAFLIIMKSILVYAVAWIIFQKDELSR